MKQKNTLLRMVSGILMAVALFASVMAPIAGFAAEDEMKETDLDSYESSLPELVEVNEDPFNVTKSDELSYDLLYFAKHADERYVNVENMDLLSMVQPVTVARGVASYNVGRQKEFSATEANFLAAVDYEVPVYDIDKDSAIAAAKEEAKVKQFTEGKTVVKEIFVPGKIINIVVK